MTLGCRSPDFTMLSACRAHITPAREAHLSMVSRACCITCGQTCNQPGSKVRAFAALSHAFLRGLAGFKKGLFKVPASRNFSWMGRWY